MSLYKSFLNHKRMSSLIVLNCLHIISAIVNILSTSYGNEHFKSKGLDSSKLKEFADDNFKFDENGSKLSKQVENTVGKGEIPSVFKRLVSQGRQKVPLCGNGLSRLSLHLFCRYGRLTRVTTRVPLPHVKIECCYE